MALSQHVLEAAAPGATPFEGFSRSGGATLGHSRSQHAPRTLHSSGQDRSEAAKHRPYPLARVWALTPA
jgi:hypothetical protein